jgi:hypothetical protein
VWGGGGGGGGGGGKTRKTKKVGHRNTRENGGERYINGHIDRWMDR